MVKPIAHLRYWNNGLLSGQLPRPRPHRYLTFDVDQGGLNNIRLVIEYAVILAAITGRTLVLPPAESWYLINHGPMPEEEQGGTTEFADIFDLDALRGVMPVLTMEEFEVEAREHLDIPDLRSDIGADDTTNSNTNRSWKQWLDETAVIPGWVPYETLICVPDIEAAATGPHLSADYTDGRTLVELTAWMNAAPVLYLPSNDRYRSLGPVATMLASDQWDMPMLSRRLLKHHVRFRPEIFSAAETIIDSLGFRGYDAIHVRRNDFQYRQTRLAARQICQNTEAIFDPDMPLYIATDEDQEAFYAAFRSEYPGKTLLRWGDVEPLLEQPIPLSWVGPIEQLLCVGSREFAGTDLSTFSAYIHRLRGYVAVENQKCHYHSNDNNGGRVAGDRLSGREYLRENPLFWLSC